MASSAHRGEAAGSGFASTGVYRSIWNGDHLRREVFFFRSGQASLYGSIYAANHPSRPFGMVVCRPWGIEADRSQNWIQWLALRMAELGGVAVTFHYPGYGDSGGDAGSVGMEDLSSAAVDASMEAARRHPAIKWIIGGLGLGASTAALASQRVRPHGLLLIDPVVDPAAYFAELARNAERSRLGGTTQGFAFGYPLPRRILADADGFRQVDAALADFNGRGAVVHYSSSAVPRTVPPEFVEIGVSGVPRFAARDLSSLAEAAATWADEVSAPATITNGGVDRQSVMATVHEQWGRESPRPSGGSLSEGEFIEHPILLDTSAGPLGAIVTEPRSSRCGAMLFLSGGGPRAGGAPRAGPNATWARVARAVAGLGVTVLRVDHPGAGESYVASGKQGSDRHVRVLEEIADSFRTRSGERDLLLLGDCYGARMAIKLAARRQHWAGVGLVAPMLGEDPHRSFWLDRGLSLVRRGRRATVNRAVRAALRKVLARSTVWALVGEAEERELLRLRESLAGGERFQIEPVPHPRVHGFESAPIQQLVMDRVLDWVQGTFVPRGTGGSDRR